MYLTLDNWHLIDPCCAASSTWRCLSTTRRAARVSTGCGLCCTALYCTVLDCTVLYRFVLYHACMDPWSQWSTPLVTVMPLSQFLLYGMNILNISCNFYLYLYLEDQRKNNTGQEILAYFIVYVVLTLKYETRDRRQN